ncbi:hypothetical protein SNE40_002388 [Patella caerulea]|uniref:Uncharacterized protein n=1 Tax=Patella caerulea TaxID=87958 RepID=A0AAN8PVV3_PATCE
MVGKYVLVAIVACLVMETVTSSPLKAMLYKAKMLKRSVYDNKIDPLPVHSRPAASGVGDQMLDEFITYLSLKETGLLDFCLGSRR